MAVIVKRVSYNGTGGGSSVALRNAIDFDTTDFSLSGGLYIITIPASSHNKGLNPIVKVYLDNGTNFEETETLVNINALGDVTISVNSSPDNRFIGKLIIL